MMDEQKERRKLFTVINKKFGDFHLPLRELIRRQKPPFSNVNLSPMLIESLQYPASSEFNTNDSPMTHSAISNNSQLLLKFHKMLDYRNGYPVNDWITEWNQVTD